MMRHLHDQQRKVLVRRRPSTFQAREEIHDIFVARGLPRLRGPSQAGLVDGEPESFSILKAGIDKPPIPARAQVDHGE
jgi:hypothetical protein